MALLNTFIHIDIGRRNHYYGIEAMRPTQTDYMILAYLKDGPEHGYRLIERMKKDNLKSVIGFSVPNIYYALRRLHATGAIKLKIKKNRLRPDQKIYSLTDSGERILSEFLQDRLLYDQQVHFRTDLIFLLAEKTQLDVSDAKAVIERRIENLSADLEMIQETWRESDTTGRQTSAMREIAFRHQIRFLKNEIDFYKKSLKELK